MALNCFLLAAAHALATNGAIRAQEQQASGAPVAAKATEAHETAAGEMFSSSTSGDPDSRSAAHENSLGLKFLTNLVADQKAILTITARLRPADAEWLLPLGVATGGMLATDTEYSKHLSNSPSRLKNSNDFSNYGVGALAGVGGAFYFWGQLTHDEHRSETGLLAGEAALDSFGLTYGLKNAFGRERPVVNRYHGNFWQGGDSFPSEHAAAAWSIASVIAHEYPGPLTAFLAYGMATAVSASRVTAKQHFPSDVLIGSAIGWFVGQHVYRAHHNPEIGGGDWPAYAESREEERGGRTGSVASPYVELDSWVYPAIERLAASGYVQSDFLDMRPWTRIECARMVEEAGEKLEGGESSPTGLQGVYRTLAREFEADLSAVARGSETSVRVESLYARSMEITGQTLHDGYHFGQTVINDSGRPFADGFNSVDGFSGWGTAGRFTVYVHGEFQHAPGSPTYSDAVRNLIAKVDANPVQAGIFPGVNQFRLLETYMAARVGDWNLSFGKQSLWWGPNYGGELMFSNDAEPIYMFRANPIEPFTLPWIFRFFGPMKMDLFMGKLSGHEFPPRPLIHGEKISFMPLPGLEFGFSRTTVFAGVGSPLTTRRLLRTYFSVGDKLASDKQDNPGDRRGGFNVSYRVPLRHDPFVIYADSLVDDDPSPLAAPRRAAMNPGIYFPRIPLLPKFDFRGEAVYTDVPTSRSNEGRFIYFDSGYHDSYTNKKYLLGNWIGREGQGIQAWTTYWMGARNSLQFGYRHSKVDGDFIPGGGTLNDGSVRANFWRNDEWNISSFVQYEKWKFPLLAATAQTNWTASVEIGFWPRSWSKSPNREATSERRDPSQGAP